MNSIPIVSVVTATRNRTDLLARALRSVAAQSCSDIEVLVVDDGSPAEVLDHHRRLLRELGDRFRLIEPPLAGGRGTGPSATRNRGALQARGQFLAFLDDDDEWSANHYLETAVTALTRHDADYLFGHLEGERDGQLQNPGWVPRREWLERERQVQEDPPIYELSERVMLTIARRFMIHPSNSVIRRSTFVVAGGFFEELWSHAEDVNLMLRVLDVARRVLYMPDLVTRYRLPAGNSISLTEAETVHSLQRILSAQHARLHCRQVTLRRCARAREAWTLRELAAAATRADRLPDAAAYAWQGWVTYPTVGALLFALRATLRSPLRSFHRAAPVATAAVSHTHRY